MGIQREVVYLLLIYGWGWEHGSVCTRQRRLDTMMSRLWVMLIMIYMQWRRRFLLKRRQPEMAKMRRGWIHVAHKHICC